MDFPFSEEIFFYYLGGPLLVLILGTIWWYFIRDPSSSISNSNNNNNIKTGDPSRSPVPSPAIKKKGAKSKDATSAKEAVATIKIFFGSQTGTAEDFSHKLANEAKRYKFHAEVIDMEEYDPEDLATEDVVMFVIATYGEGEPTDNSREFYEWLINDSRPSDLLPKLKYTVFGLGNKTYEQYNLMGKKFDQRMEQMGAQRIFRLGLGDDDASLEEDFAAWKKELWPALCKHYGIEAAVGESGGDERRFKIQFYPPESPQAKTAAEISKHHLCKKQSVSDSNSYDIKNPYLAKVIVNRELHTHLSDRSCRHIEIDIGRAISYEAGDHLGVYPENDIETVEGTAKRLGVDLNAVFSLFNAEKQISRPLLGPCTVRQALMQWCDLTNPPRKSVLKVLATYAQDHKEKEFLLALSNEEKSVSFAFELGEMTNFI